MVPRSSLVPSLAGLLGVALLGVAPLAAQSPSPVRNQLFVGSLSSVGFSIDQDGSPGLLLSNATLRGPVRIAPDGTPWAVARTNFGALTTAVAFRPATPNALAPGFIAQGLGGEATALAVTAQSHALVGVDNGTLVEVDRNTTGGIVNTIQLAGRPTAVEVDERGRVWVGIRNSPSPLIQVLDLTAGSSNLLPVPTGRGDVVRILPDGRPGRSRVFATCSGDPTLFAFDPTLALVGSFRAPGAPGIATLAELELAPDGSVWALSPSSGLWRFDPTSNAFTRLIQTDRIESFGFDAHGTLWHIEAGRPGSPPAIGPVDVPTLAFGPTIATPYGGSWPRILDGGGLYIAQVLDQQGDSDQDGFANRAEIDARSNPFDPNSTPVVDLSARLDCPTGSDAVLRLRGSLGVGVIAFANSRAPVGVPLPGIGGTFELRPTNLLGEPFTALVPGELRLPVPTILRATTIYAQAVNLPVVGTPQFSDTVPIHLRPAAQVRISEPFNDAGGRDDAASTGVWGNGSLQAARLGGRGLLGAFDPTEGTAGGPNRWVFSTDDQLFSRTPFGAPIRVTDGVFEFSTMVIPAGTTVAFRGRNPAVIKVRGDLRIEGTLDVAGASPSGSFDPRSVFDNNLARFVGVPGQPGAAGGPGAGAGGTGGRGCEGNGNVAVATGSDAEPIQAPGSSGYATAMGRAATAGRGAPPFPATALTGSVTFSLFNAICCQMGAGGSGGAFLSAGGASRAFQSAAGQTADLGPAMPGGSAVPLLLPPNGVSSLDQFLVGGAGGGGGGSHPVNLSSQQVLFEIRAWHAGAGGAGGGGALALRVGDEVTVGASGVVDARGGEGPTVTDRNMGPAMPGGGGAGGTVLIQMLDGALLNQAGLLDVSGGDGGEIDFVQFNGQRGIARGGQGGFGLVRLEATSNASTNALGRVLGPANLGADNIGTLADQDAWSGAQSVFYDSGALVAPHWERYVVRATYNGLTLTFSDDPRVGPSPNLPGQPFRFFVQGGRRDPATGEVEPVGPFRTSTAMLQSDAVTHARFLVLFDRSVDPDVRLDDVQIEASR